MDPLWSETRWSSFKYFIILTVSTYYVLCTGWIIKCLSLMHGASIKIAVSCPERKIVHWNKAQHSHNSWHVKMYHYDKPLQLSETKWNEPVTDFRVRSTESLRSAKWSLVSENGLREIIHKRWYVSTIVFIIFKYTLDYMFRPFKWSS